MSLNKNDVIIKQLEEQLADYNNDLNSARSQLKKVRSCMTAIAEKVCDSEYGENQLSGKNLMSSLDDIALRDFIIKNVTKQKINFTKNISSLQKMYLQEQKEKDEIAQKLLQAQKEANEYKRMYDELAKGKDINFNTAESVSENQNISQSIINKDNQNSILENNSTNMIYYNKMPYDIDEIYNKIDVYQLKVLKIIGETGFSETNEIVDKCVESQELGSTTFIRDIMKNMIDNLLLETENISTPIRRKLTLYSLTPIGVAIYKKEYKKLPIKDEKTKIKEMHATLQHGYCIKDTAKILNDLGYTNISIDSSKNSIEVANNRRYVPDIIADFDVKTKTYWEVELGHHHDNDFFEKLEKAAKVTSTVYVVVNDAQTKTKVAKQVANFKLKLKQEHRTIKLVVVLGTMMELSKKDVFFNPNNKFDLSK